MRDVDSIFEYGTSNQKRSTSSEKLKLSNKKLSTSKRERQTSNKKTSNFFCNINQSPKRQAQPAQQNQQITRLLL
jgi:hypothetical protein